MCMVSVSMQDREGVTFSSMVPVARRRYTYTRFFCPSRHTLPACNHDRLYDQQHSNSDDRALSAVLLTWYDTHKGGQGQALLWLRTACLSFAGFLHRHVICSSHVSCIMSSADRALTLGVKHHVMNKVHRTSRDRKGSGGCHQPD